MLKHPLHQVLPYDVVHATTRARARWTLVAVVVNLSRVRDRAPVRSVAMAGWFYRAMHREPVVMWSCFIGAAGMAMPLIVPRGAFESAETRATGVPNAAAVAAALRPGTRAE